MMDYMSALELDKRELGGETLGIVEEDKCQASFLHSVLMSKAALDSSTGLLLVLAHETFEHYSQVSTRLGYDLDQMAEEGRCTLVDIMQMDLDGELDVLLKEGCCGLVKLISAELEKQMERTPKVYLVVDDLSHLLMLGVTSRDLFYCIHYLRTLVTEDVTLILGCHVWRGAEMGELERTVLGVCDWVMEASYLRTGFSHQVSGSIRSSRVSSPPHSLHFKLSDRGVRIFPPGAAIL